MVSNFVTTLVILNAFSDFFSSSVDCLSRYNDPISAYYISNCYFKMVNSLTSKGGVVYFVVNTVQLVVESCVFTECSTTGNNNDGGAIYFGPADGGIAVSKVCAHSCTAVTSGSTSYYPKGQFACVICPNGKKAFFEFFSCYKCAPESFALNKKSAIYIEKGTQNVTSGNFSRCFTNRQAGFQTVSSSSFLGSFLTYDSNRPSEAIVVLFESASGPVLLKKCNFINNSSSANEGIIHSTTTSTIIDQCAFSLNFNTLLTGSLMATGCWINHTTVTSGTQITLVSPLTYLESHSLTNFGSAMCITPTPGPTTITEEPPHGEDSTPCATQFAPPTPPQSLPPLPTECAAISDNGVFTISGLFPGILMSFLVFLM